MRILDATVTRRSRSGDIIGPAQRVDVLTALKAMTIWPAWQHFEEESKGSIEPGKLADLVILSADPTAVDPEALDQLEVLETIKEGVTIFRLSDEGERSAEFGARADSFGETALSRFLVAAGHAGGAASAHGSHAGSCGCGFVAELAAAMTGSSGTAVN
jgi:hypothetical protein